MTRIEGHAKITIQLDDDDEVGRTAFHVTQVRGFEKFTEGRPYLRDAVDHRPHLRHLPDQPSAGLGQGVRRHHERAHPADRREAARSAALRRNSCSRTR